MALAAGIAWCLALLHLTGPGVAAWHARALGWGFIGAAVGGYLLSALPGWSGGPPVTGAALAGLVAAWGLGLGGLLSGVGAGEMAPSGLALLFPLALAAVLGRDLLAARAFGKLWVLAFPLGLAVQGAGPALGIGAGRGHEPAALALMLGISAIGGPLICAFGAAHRQRQGRADMPAGERRTRLVASVATTFLALAVALSFVTDRAAAGGVLVLAGVVQLWLPLYWLARRGPGRALFLLLPLAYLWLPFGVIGLGVVQAGVTLAGLKAIDALHALTMGAASCMIAAVAGRVAARRAAGALHARPVQIVAFGALWLAALARVASGVAGSGEGGWLLASALLWVLGWGLWLLALGPALIGPPRRPALSAIRAPDR